jgi:hypothetical protein
MAGSVRARKHYGRIILIAAAILILLYAVAGFFILPSYLKSKLQEVVAARTGMDARIGGVRVNPFALSFTLEDFSLAGADHQSVFALKRLYLNFEVRSIFAKAAVFSEIAIDSPYVRVLVRPDGTTNLPTFAAADSAGGAAGFADTTVQASSNDIHLVIDRFVLTRGRAIYEDRTHLKPRTARVDSLNLTLNDFTTRPNEKGEYAFDAYTDRGEKLSWQGMIQAAPFKSSGTIALAGIKASTVWEFMQDRLHFELTDGELAARAAYVVDMSAPRVVFRLANGEMNARGVRLIDNETKTEQAQFSSASVSGMELDYGKKSIRIGAISGTGARLHTDRDLKGDLSLPALLTTIPDPAAPKEAPWKIVIDRIRLNDYTLEVSDQNTIPATDIVLSPVAVEIDHYTVLSSKPASLVVRGGMKPGGSFTLNGAFTDEPVTAVITLSCTGIQLPVFQRFVDKSAKLTIQSGALAVNGRLDYAARGGDTTMNFAGSVSVSSFRATDQLSRRDFLRWRQLDLRNIHYALKPASLAIDEIAAQEAYVRFIIDSSRTSNVQKIMAVHADSTQPQMAAGPVTAADSIARANAAVPTKIKLVRIANSSMNFADYSLSPNFATGIQEMNGTISGLNSQALTHADVTLDGKVDRYAPVEIRGQINPLSEEAFTDITMKFHNIELTTFTPYAGKFAGYKIDKGKLSLDLHYKLNKDLLEAENAIVIDQLTLGEKVEGPDVTSIPVRLAVALLKDSKGVIDLDLPVKGSLNDPEFSVFPIILKVLVNLLSKAVLSPFKLLSGLVGSGEDDLSAVQFRPGIDSLETAEYAKLDALVKALNERPGLRLEVRGLVSDSLDRFAVADSRLLRQVRAKGGAGRELKDADNDRLLQLYKEHFKTDPDLLVPEEKDKKGSSEEREALIVARARQKLTEAFLPDDDALLGLARRRAMAVKDRLVFHSGMDEGRIFLLDFQKGAKTDNGFVQMPLSLEAQ